MNSYLKNKICLVEYKDASYSFSDSIRIRKKVPKDIKTVGMVRRTNKQLVDLAIQWCHVGPKNKKIKYIKGIVIPGKAVKRIICLK